MANAADSSAPPNQGKPSIRTKIKGVKGAIRGRSGYIPQDKEERLRKLSLNVGATREQLGPRENHTGRKEPKKN